MTQTTFFNKYNLYKVAFPTTDTNTIMGRPFIFFWGSVLYNFFFCLYFSKKLKGCFFYFHFFQFFHNHTWNISKIEQQKNKVSITLLEQKYLAVWRMACLVKFFVFFLIWDFFFIFIEYQKYVFLFAQFDHNNTVWGRNCNFIFSNFRKFVFCLRNFVSKT